MWWMVMAAAATCWAGFMVGYFRGIRYGYMLARSFAPNEVPSYNNMMENAP